MDINYDWLFIATESEDVSARCEGTIIIKRVLNGRLYQRLLDTKYISFTSKNASVLSIGPWRTNFCEIWIKNVVFIHENPFENVVCRIASASVCIVYGKDKLVTSIIQIHTVSLSNEHCSLNIVQNSRHFAHDTSKCLLLNESVFVWIKISPKFVRGVQLAIYKHLFLATSINRISIWRIKSLWPGDAIW